MGAFHPGLRDGSDRVTAAPRGSAGAIGTLMAALVIATALPCVALVWPGVVPRTVVVLALTAWAGIFVVTLLSAYRS